MSTDDGDGGVGGETRLLEEEGEVRGRVVLLLELDHALGHVGRHARVRRNVVLWASWTMRISSCRVSGVVSCRVCVVLRVCVCGT